MYLDCSYYYRDDDQYANVYPSEDSYFPISYREYLDFLLMVKNMCIKKRSQSVCSDILSEFLQEYNRN